MLSKKLFIVFTLNISLTSNLTPGINLNELTDLLTHERREKIQTFFLLIGKYRIKYIEIDDQKKINLNYSGEWYLKKRGARARQLKSKNHMDCPLACVLTDNNIIYSTHIDYTSLQDITAKQVVEKAKSAESATKEPYFAEYCIAEYLFQHSALEKSSRMIKNEMNKNINARLLLIGRTNTAINTLKEKINVKEYDTNKVNSIVVSSRHKSIDYEIDIQEKKLKVYENNGIDSIEEYDI